MTHRYALLVVAAVFSIVVVAGWNTDMPAPSVTQEATEPSPPGTSVSPVETPPVAQDTAEGPTPRLVKADAKVPVVGTSDQQAAQLDEMLKPYTNLSAGEAAYFDGKFLNKDVLGEVMQSADFNSKLLDLQSGGDINAMARQRAYTDTFKRSLQPYADRARLERIGCGTVLCMGSLRTSTKDWIGPWTVELHKQPLPLPSLSIQTIRRAGEYEVRFSFTTSGSGGFAGNG